MVTIQIKTPELEVLIQKRLQEGRFRDVDDLLTKALEALPESSKHGFVERPRKRLIDVLTSPAFAGSGLTVERITELPQPPVDL